MWKKIIKCSPLNLIRFAKAIIPHYILIYRSYLSHLFLNANKLF